MEKVTLDVILWEEDGVMIAYIPQLGIVSQGETRDEALANVREAAEAFLEEHGEIPEREYARITISFSRDRVKTHATL